ncbi:phosphonate C-P lyase system protein PhnG [Paralimibaculum aggregatum]|uniref:Phosphonate C-P lyase system protein PhnG n=2 Tax=Paralimibaculum aggregatum TaxID=3036245 RepID=A0ABQ6LM51_9RHOB|nr:phosphonate C-P lyase system protein PhnG [Limibaculum sp. NKW23]
MSLFAKAAEDRLAELWQAAAMAPDFTWLRRPESGAVMLRGLAGGQGAPFNLGEMTVTRASVRLAGGQVGHGYVAGRSKRKAEIAALCDALMQDPAAAPAVEAAILGPLAREAEAAAAKRAAKAAATKVEFFTMQRGED